MCDFSEHCRLLSADSNYLYSQEYTHIPRKNASKTMHHSQNQDNRESNRYNNILCYDATRVILKTDPTGNDYINASYLSGFEKEKAYIASQGPLENTCEQFWRMVWENSTRTIVMVRFICYTVGVFGIQNFDGPSSGKLKHSFVRRVKVL